jgi:hypothetical protein
MLKRLSGRVFALLALTSLVACNAYNDSLLVGSLSPSIPAGGDSGKGGGAGEANGAAAGIHHVGDAGAGGEDGPGGSGHAGALVAEAGSSGHTGSAGNANVGGTSGASGMSGLAGGPGSAGMPAAGSSGAPTGEQIDDFEDQDEFILRLAMRNGPWYVFSDATTTGTLGKLTIAPLTGADVRPSSPSTAALHLTASGFADWGAGVGADMVNLSSGKKAPYDVSAYRGIRFYAKIGSGTTSTVKVLLPNIYSDADGGKCSDADSKKRCGDHLFKSVSGLKATWDVYEVNFIDFTQQPFGLPQTGFDSTGVYSVQFTMMNKLAIDLWLDDVTFVLK